jgi:divalent metal cation (Fe/Co/Zn/Cd) transporter
MPVTVLLVAIALESFSFRTAIHESNLIRGRTGWLEFIRRAKAPELPVILLEDFAALLGLVFALFGVSMTLATGNGMWDAVGTAMIGVLLVTVAIVLAIETKSLLIGESATSDTILAIERAINAGPDVERIIHLRTMHLGPDELLVAAKIGIRPECTAEEIARTIDTAEERIREVTPIARVIYLEPDIYRGGPAVLSPALAPPTVPQKPATPAQDDGTAG